MSVGAVFKCVTLLTNLENRTLATSTGAYLKKAFGLVNKHVLLVLRVSHVLVVYGCYAPYTCWAGQSNKRIVSGVSVIITLGTRTLLR